MTIKKIIFVNNIIDVCLIEFLNYSFIIYLYISISVTKFFLLYPDENKYIDSRKGTLPLIFLNLGFQVRNFLKYI